MEKPIKKIIAVCKCCGTEMVSENLAGKRFVQNEPNICKNESFIDISFTVYRKGGHDLSLIEIKEVINYEKIS